MELEYIDKHFVKKARKKATQRNVLEFYSPRYSSIYILNEKFNPKMTFSDFQKKAGKTSTLPSSCAPVSVT